MSGVTEVQDVDPSCQAAQGCTLQSTAVERGRCRVQGEQLGETDATLQDQQHAAAVRDDVEQPSPGQPGWDR